jgi:hypothetical protein
MGICWQFSRQYGLTVCPSHHTRTLCLPPLLFCQYFSVPARWPEFSTLSRLNLAAESQGWSSFPSRHVSCCSTHVLLIFFPFSSSHKISFSLCTGSRYFDLSVSANWRWNLLLSDPWLEEAQGYLILYWRKHKAIWSLIGQHWNSLIPNWKKTASSVQKRGRFIVTIINSAKLS